MGHQREGHTRISERNQSDEKSKTTDNSIQNNSRAKTLVEYGNDATLDIKDKIIEGMTWFVIKIS